MGNDMTGQQALGVIRGISARWDRKELFVYPDRMVLVSSGDFMWSMLARQFGLVGLLIYRLGAKSRAAAAEQRRQQSPEQLMAFDPRGVQILVGDIVDARLTTGLLSAKLQLSLVDGTSPTYSWGKSENQTDVVRGFLRAALGTRLIDQQKAA